MLHIEDINREFAARSSFSQTSASPIFADMPFPSFFSSKPKSTAPTLAPVERAPWTEASQAALSRLRLHVPTPEPCPNEVPAYRRAAVLIGLFQGRNGELYVILSQRSTGLRSHAGDTALPGGRFETKDSSLEATAVGTLATVL